MFNRYGSVRIRCVNRCLPVVLAAVLASCGGGKDSPTATSTTPIPVVNYTLTVVVGEGVTGSPSTPASTFAAGTSVPYAFSAASGYDSVRVVTDSATAPVSGTIVMNANHRLYVTAGLARDLAPTDPVLVATKGLLTAADPVIAYATLIARLMNASATQSDSQVNLTARKASLMAFDPNRDAPALQRVGEALAGRTFELSDSGVTEASSSALVRSANIRAVEASAAATADATPTDVIYVNGILNDPATGAYGATLMYKTLRMQGVPIGRSTSSWDLGNAQTTPMQFHFHYNPSQSASMVSASALVRCFISLSLVTALPFVAASTQALTYCPAISGMVEVTTQWLAANNIFGQLAETLPLGVAASLRDLVDLKRHLGRNVILVGHSQGNMLAQAALFGLPSLATTEGVGCLSGTSVASPVGAATATGSNNWPNLDIAVQGRIAGDDNLGRQDILRRLNNNRYPQFPAMSSQAVVDAWKRVQGLSWIKEDYVGVVEDIKLHGLDVYMSAAETRAWFTQSVSSQYEGLANKCRGSLSGQVVSSGTGAAVTGATVQVQTVSGVPVASTTTDATGSFKFDTLRARTYQLTISAATYKSLPASTFKVRAREPLSAGRFTLVGDASQVGGASGYIRNARTLGAVAGATIELRPGVNMVQGQVTISATSSTSGFWSVSDVAPGVYTAKVSATGYSQSARTVVISGASTATDQLVDLYPTSSGNDIGIVLFWGVYPYDLDAHLTGPTATTDRFHVYWWDGGSLSSAPFAALDVDDVYSYGPETITITQQRAGVYRYSVHDYSNRTSPTSLALAASGATVRLFMPGRSPQTFTVPYAPGTLWSVFEIEGSQVRVLNQMSVVSAPNAVPLREEGLGTTTTDAVVIQRGSDAHAKRKP